MCNEFIFEGVSMDKIYLIYEWYDHCYFGFADYKSKLVHFAFKDKSYTEYLLKLSRQQKNFLIML